MSQKKRKPNEFTIGYKAMVTDYLLYEDCYKAEYARRHLGECYEGRISGVTQRGLFIELENGVEGFVPASSLTATGTMLTEGVRLSDPVSGKNWNLGDTMMITIVRADVNLGKIDFEVAPESAKQ